MMLWEKSGSWWAVVVGMTVWVFMTTSPIESLRKRLAKTFVSATLAFGLSTELAGILSIGEAPAAVAIMAFGLIILDTATAVLTDKKLLTDIVRDRLGVDDDKS